jgi:hypothetical protein
MTPDQTVMAVLLFLALWGVFSAFVERQIR